MKKRTHFWPQTLLITVFTLLGFLVTCPALAAEKLQVVASTPDLADLTRAVGGTRVEVSSLALGSQDYHFVPARPSFILKLKQADVLVHIGLDLEQWLPPLVASSRNGKIFTGGLGNVDCSIGLPLLQVPQGRVDRSMGDIHGNGNPHYWLDPVNARYITANIANGLKRVDPAGAAYYDAQRTAYLKQLAPKITQWMNEAKPLKGLKVVAYHNSWPYFEKRFGLNIVGFIEPKPGIPPSPKHIQTVITLMKSQDVKIIIMEPYFSQSIAEMIAKAAGAKVVILPPAIGAIPSVTSYMGLFETQLDRLNEAIR